MELINQYSDIVAFTIARIFLGTLFFFQGVDAVFNIKVKNIILTSETTFLNKGIPRFLIVLGCWFTSYAELVGGGFLILGLFQYCSLYLLGLNLIIASVAFSISTPMWDTRFVFPRLVLLLFLLVAPHSWGVFALDHLLFKN